MKVFCTYKLTTEGFYFEQVNFTGNARVNNGNRCPHGNTKVSLLSLCPLSGASTVCAKLMSNKVANITTNEVSMRNNKVMKYTFKLATARL